MVHGAWWPLALSEAVPVDAPVGVVCGDQEFVLFRNSQGEVCAVEDRCPHRRVPLSGGKVVEGHIRCPYHGWTFDGRSGACVAIPNLSADEKVPSSYRVTTHVVAEKNGFVNVWIGEGSPTTELPFDGDNAQGVATSGAGVVAMSFPDYRTAFIDGPQVLIDMTGVSFTDFFLGDPKREGDMLVTDRGADWGSSQKSASRWKPDYPLILRTETSLSNGVMVVRLLSQLETPLLSLQLAAAPGRRNTTAFSWRAYVHPEFAKAAPLKWRLARALGQPAVRLTNTPDPVEISQIPIALSIELDQAPALSGHRTLVAE